MKRFILTAAIFAALMTATSFGQARNGRCWSSGARAGQVRQGNHLRAGRNYRAAAPAAARQQLRDTQNCPRTDDRPGCGEPRPDRQYKWRDGDPGPGGRGVQGHGAGRRGGGRGGRGGSNSWRGQFTGPFVK